MIYKDDLGAICRRWNWKEAERTKLTAATRNAVLVLEGLPPVGREAIERAASELAEQVRTQCGGRVAVVMVDRDQMGITLSPPT